MVSIYEKIDLTIQKQESKDMYIIRTALIHLVKQTCYLPGVSPARIRTQISAFGLLLRKKLVFPGDDRCRYRTYTTWVAYSFPTGVRLPAAWNARSA